MKIIFALAAAALVFTSVVSLNAGGAVCLGLCKEVQQVGMPGALQGQMQSICDMCDKP